MDERVVTAYHEAGHALACHRAGSRVFWVTLEPDDDYLERLLRSEVWQARVDIVWGELTAGSARARRWARTIALLALAGPAAEERFAGHVAHGATDDDRLAERFLGAVYETPDEVANCMARLEAEAATMVNNDWPPIEALAQKLLDQDRVSGRLARRVFLAAEQARVERPRGAEANITEDDLRCLPGLRQVAITNLLVKQPRTVEEALAIRDVGRKVTRVLLAAGLITGRDGVQTGSAQGG